METTLSYLLYFILIVTCATGLANEPFEIPRSAVIELTEPASKRIYPVFIKLPRSYAINKDKKYPVIYLMDAWYSFQIASGATRFPMNSGTMKEAIIVGISYSRGSKGPSSRIRDYTPVQATNWKFQTGHADGHAKFIRESVFAYIEQNYRTLPSQRTFVGHSLGGLFGAYILFNYPDMFSSYIIGSPSVWFANNDILHSSVMKPRLPTKVYVSVGSLEQPKYGEKQHMVAGAQKLIEKMTAECGKNTTIKFRIIEGAKHATAFPSTLIQGLDWIYTQQ
ncbi:alpha/beta hydrolase [Pseudoalteromonas ruthenica]|uniref:alpha/beta hydrolase n=1 Tax=Pseudoalteromonas ruthenica TaxID=151081 RepID=UPI00241CDCAC|nr:alpha/beta hydrolase-fold protein [Pseudoalteromonas ruthenica]|tara:strand:+ start:109468 stop:110304 length:837 start_codon:yes stop_codon:yes gene_type:complete